MSTLIQAKCWPLQMPPTPKSVLISLADNANDQGDCWPSITTIAMRTCFSERAIRNAIDWLEEHGLLIADRSNGRHTRYLVTPERFRPPASSVDLLADPTPAPDAPVSNHEPRHDMPQSADPTPAPRSITPAADAGVPRHEVQKPRHEVPSNHQEPSLEPSKNRKARQSEFPAESVLSGLGVDAQVAKDWLLMRKKRRAVVTQTVIDGIAREAAKAGITLGDALLLMQVRGWQGFHAAWLRPDRGGGGGGGGGGRGGGQGGQTNRDASRSAAAAGIGLGGRHEPYTIDQ